MKTRVMMLCVLLLTAAVLIEGCRCGGGKKTAGAYNPCAAPAMVSSSQPFPMADGKVIKLEKMAPEEVRINEPFSYQMKVTNLTDRDLENVSIRDCMAENLTINSSSPEISRKEGKDCYWDIGTLEANGSRTITINAVAETKGTIASCGEVTFDSPLCAKIAVVEPQIRLAKSAPSEVVQCDRIPITYTVTNMGDGYACGVTINESLPQGLRTSDGSNEISYTIESLAPGESHEFSELVDPMEGGEFSSSAQAMIGSGSSVESNLTTTAVRKPVLAIHEVGPERQYTGRPLTYEITVRNEGDGIARDAVIELGLPEDAQFGSASDNGIFTRSSPGKVSWNVGALEPNETKKVSVTVMSDKEGTLVTKAAASAYCAEAVTDSASTTLSGISAVLLEVIDVSDPVEIGENTTYVINVTNQGSAAGTGIQITCELEDGMEYVSSEGPTQASVSGNTITFSPLKNLAAKGSTQWRVTVRAEGEGDVRFKTMLKTDQIERMVEETEATRFYE